MEPPRTYPVVVPDTALSSCRHAATSQCRYVGFYIGKIPAKTLTLGNSQNQRLLNILAHASGRLIYRKTGRSAVKQTHTVHGANETKIMQDINSFVVAKRTLHKIICLCNFSKFNNNSNTVIIIIFYCLNLFLLPVLTSTLYFLSMLKPSNTRQSSVKDCTNVYNIHLL